MGKLKTTPSQLWEQWLARLHGAEDPQKNYYRLELLQLLSKAGGQEADKFCHRLGTILGRSLHSGRVFIIDYERDRLIYGDSALTGKDLAKKLGFKQSGNGGLSIRHFPRGTRALIKGAAVKSICLLPLRFLPDKRLSLAILYQDGVPGDDRQFLHFISGVFALLEQHQLTERQLEQEERLLNMLTQHINEGLVLFSGDLRVRIWNRPLQRITGFSPKEALGQPFGELIRVPGQPNWLTDLVETSRQAGQSGFVFDGQILTKTKHLRWISISGSFLRDDSGQVEQVIALVRDISREKLLEQSKNEFISIATHELRTPITAIKGYLSLLQSTVGNLSDKQRLYLNNAVVATERLVGLAEDLLQVIRLEEDRMKFNLQPVRLTKIIEKVSADFSEKARSKGLEFRLALPPFDTLVVADPIRLEQVFANLVDNAIKYTSQGSISISFEHYSEKVTKEDKVTVVIKDTGIGIDSRDLEGVFEKFHRSDRAANLREPGAGLGLFIVKSFIEKQGGKISVKSRPRRGSTFAVTFPTIDRTRLDPVGTLSDQTALAHRKKRSSMGRQK